MCSLRKFAPRTQFLSSLWGGLNSFSDEKNVCQKIAASANTIIAKITVLVINDPLRLNLFCLVYHAIS